MTDTTTETVKTVQYDLSTVTNLTAQAQAALTSAGDLLIDSADMASIAGDELREVKGLQKMVEAQRVSITGPLNAAVKGVNDLFRAPAEWLVQAENSIKRSLLAYQTKVEAEAREAKRKADAEAAAERKRLDDIRIAAEAAQRAAEAAATLAAEELEAATEAGDTVAAEAASVAVMQHTETMLDAQDAAENAVLTAAVVTFTPAVVAPAKIQGISGRVNYTASVTDLMELVKAVAAGTAPVQCLMADEKFLGAQARAFKTAGPLFPGVTCNAERSISARAA